MDPKDRKYQENTLNELHIFNGMNYIIVNGKTRDKQNN